MLRCILHCVSPGPHLRPLESTLAKDTPPKPNYFVSCSTASAKLLKQMDGWRGKFHVQNQIGYPMRSYIRRVAGGSSGNTVQGAHFI